jgi:hypothetical protein
MNESEGVAPDFILVGAMKGGTTSLCHYLGEHPQIHAPALKEPHFWSVRGGRRFQYPDGAWIPSTSFIADTDEYQALFRGRQSGQLTFEASTHYLPDPHVVAALAADASRCKVIVALRQPVDRACSAFAFNRVADAEPAATLAEAVGAEKSGRRDQAFYRWRYLVSGEYAVALQRYREFSFLGVDPDFSPVTAVRHNETKRTGTVAEAVAHRLLVRNSPLKRAARGAALRVLPNATRHQINHYLATRARPRQLQEDAVDDAMREQLHAHFAPDIDALEQLLARDLSAWRQR